MRLVHLGEHHDLSNVDILAAAVLAASNRAMKRVAYPLGTPGGK